MSGPVVDMRPLREAIYAAMGPVSPDCRRYVEVVFGDAPVTSSKRLAFMLGTRPSSLVSRFWRAGLPTPKDLLTHAMLYRIAVLRDRGLSFFAISLELDFSSPQSLSRFVLTHTGQLARAYFAAHSAAGVLALICDDFRALAPQWSAVRPLGRAA